MSSPKRIAYWMSDKKSQKINWKEFQMVCRKYGFELFKIDFNKSLESQQPFTIFLHKLTDIIASANEGNESSLKIMETIESFLKHHSGVAIIDPIDKVRQVLNRYNTFKILNRTEGILTPNFCNIPCANIRDITTRLNDANINYPFLCKPYLAHGSKEAHKMMIIFNENNLKDCMIPCVAQSFINHNAVLYKIFIVGSKNHLVERPSLKNFYPGENLQSIFFDSSLVSKAGACSDLTVLDPCEDDKEVISKPNDQVVNHIAQNLRNAFGMDLLGADFIVDKETGKYYIIDINAYPGYDGFPNLYESLIQLIIGKVNSLHDNETEPLKKNLPCDNYTKSSLNLLGIGPNNFF